MATLGLGEEEEEGVGQEGVSMRGRKEPVKLYLRPGEG
jgi:hypothetical protein